MSDGFCNNLFSIKLTKDNDVRDRTAKPLGTIENWKEILEARLDKLLASWSGKDPILIDLMLWSVSGGGKRLRPLLFISAAKAVGGDPLSFIDAACSFELIHAASLIIDDLPCMDNSGFRRGKPSLHKVTDEAISILTSISLISAAFKILTSCGQSNQDGSHTILRSVRILSTAIGPTGMVGGQYADLVYDSIPLYNDNVKRTLQRKTSALFIAAVEIGSILAGACEEDVLSLKGFAEKIGLAFQIIDLNDIEQDKESGRKGFNYARKVGSLAAEREARHLIDEGREIIKRFGESGIELLAITNNIKSLIP